MANAAVGHLTMLFTMAWLPLALCLYHQWLETGGAGRLRTQSVPPGRTALAPRSPVSRDPR